MLLFINHTGPKKHNLPIDNHYSGSFTFLYFVWSSIARPNRGLGAAGASTISFKLSIHNIMFSQGMHVCVCFHGILVGSGCLVVKHNKDPCTHTLYIVTVVAPFGKRY